MDGEGSEDLIRDRLGPDEKLLWSGQPKQGVMLRAADAFLIPFSLMWGGFAIFWEATAIVDGGPWLAAIWGIPFVLIGLYLIFGRFVVDARQRAATAYAVTSERVIILSGVFARKVKSLDLATISDMSLTEQRDGAGMITFGPLPPYFGLYGGAAWPGLPSQAASTFELTSDARQLYEIVRSAQRATRHRPEPSAAARH